MKLQVIVKNSIKAMSTSISVDAVVEPATTVLATQQLAAELANVIAFPDQELLFQGSKLPTNQRLSDCGIKNGDTLELSFQASEQTLTKQITDLLGDQSMSLEELSHLYIYRKGMSLEQAIKTLGLGDSIPAFLENHKHFSVEGGRVKATSSQNASQPSAEEDQRIEINVSISVETSKKPMDLISDDEDAGLQIKLQTSQTIAEAKEVIATIFQMPFPDRDLTMGAGKLEDGLSLKEAGIKHGASLVMEVRPSEKAFASQLQDLLKERAALSTNELGLLYCQRHGTPINQALRALGLHANLRRFLENNSQFSITGGCVTLVKL